MSTTTIFILLLLFLFLNPPTTTSLPILGLDSYLTQQSHKDPQATNDTFLSLSSSLKRSLSSQHITHIPSLISSLLSLKIQIPIHIKLVGSFSPESHSLLSSFISNTQFSDNFHIIGADPHHLSISHSPHLEISHSSISSQIFDALRSEIDRSPSSLRSTLQSVPYPVVDRIIEKDFQKEKPVHGIYIYLLNLNPQSKPYGYSYSPGESSPAFTKCLGSIWTGKERYIWIDLAAGPVDYGPALSGDGVLPKGEFHPLAALHGRPKSQKALLADLASLVWSAYQKDAARRNTLLTSLNYTIASAVAVLESISAHGGDRYLLKKGRHTEFVQRWNLLKYKLDKAVSALSHFDFEMAVYFIRSSDHDLYAIHSLVYEASQELEASLVCFQDPPFPWGTVSVSGLIFLTFSYAYAKRDKLFQNKRKRF